MTWHCFRSLWIAPSEAVVNCEPFHSLLCLVPTQLETKQKETHCVKNIVHIWLACMVHATCPEQAGSGWSWCNYAELAGLCIASLGPSIGIGKERRDQIKMKQTKTESKPFWFCSCHYSDILLLCARFASGHNPEISKTIFRTIKDRNMELLYLRLFKVSSLVETLCCVSMPGLLKLFVLKMVITSL